MKKFHVHVYKLEAMAEVEVTAGTEEDAMRNALKKVKDGQVEFIDSDNKHMAVPFEIE